MKTKLLKTDPKSYPVDSLKENLKNGFYTTKDIIEIFKNIKKETLQDWLKFHYIEPKYIFEKEQRSYKYFVPSQLALIGLFKKLIDLGVNRKKAWTWVVAFHNMRADLVKKEGLEPDFCIVEVLGKEVKKIKAIIGKPVFYKNVKEQMGNDVVIINFSNILNLINGYER